MFLAQFAQRVRRRLFPNEHERAVAKFYRDGGVKLLFSLALGPIAVVLDIGGLQGRVDGQCPLQVWMQYFCI